jgi:hypothetical protein
VIAVIQEKKTTLFFILTVYFMTACYAVRGVGAAEHLMSESALHFDEYAVRGFTADMTKIEYEEKLSEMTSDISVRYALLVEALDETGRAKLEKAQSSWEDFVSKYAHALENMLYSTIKVFYGVKGQERFTNVYMENILALYRHRIIDLGRWGSSGPKTTSFKSDTSDEELAKSFGLIGPYVIYLTPERFRPDQYAMENAWRAYMDVQLDFLHVLHGGDEQAVEDERKLMLSRMFSLMSLQEEGLNFFRFEREE